MQLRLIDFNARFYSPALGRFIQPDSIIPDLTSSQAWNRYSYVLNSPIMYMDPSGHVPCLDGLECDPSVVQGGGFVTYAGSGWESGEKTTIRNSAEDVANSLARDWNNFISENYELLSLTGDSLDDLLVTPLQIWNAVFGGPVNFTKFKEKREYGAFTRSHNQIDLYSTSDTYIVNNPRLIVHELGHAFDNALCVANPTCDPDTDSPGSNPGRLSVPSILITNWGDTVNGYHGYAGGWENWQYRNFDKSTAYENFADMFIGWTYNRWWSYWETGHSLATERQDYMNSSMIQWLPLFFGNN